MDIAVFCHFAEEALCKTTGYKKQGASGVSSFASCTALDEKNW
jgi:hypothetical protein